MYFKISPGIHRIERINCWTKNADSIAMAKNRYCFETAKSADKLNNASCSSNFFLASDKDGRRNWNCIIVWIFSGSIARSYSRISRIPIRILSIVVIIIISQSLAAIALSPPSAHPFRCFDFFFAVTSSISCASRANKTACGNSVG